MTRALLRRGTPPRFDSLHAHLQTWMRKGREARYHIGATLLTIRDGKLYEKAGFTTFHDYLDSLKSSSRRTLQRYMALALKVDLTLALEIEPDRLELAVKLLDGSKKPAIVDAETIRALKIKAQRNGRVVKVRFDDATTEELEAAVAELERARLPQLPAEVTRLLETVSKLLGQGPGALGDVRVRRRGKRTLLVLEVPSERGGELVKLMKRQR